MRILPIQIISSILLALGIQYTSELAKQYWIITWPLCVWLCFSTVNFIRVHLMHKMLRANSSNPFHRYEKPTLKKLETIKYFYFYCKFQKDLRPILEHYEISEDDFVQLYLKADTNANICSNNRGQLVDFPQDAFLSAPCLQLMCWYKDQSDTEFSNLATLIKMGCKSDFMPMLADEIHEKGVHFVFQKIHSGVG